MPPEAQWFANLDSVQTRRAYESDIRAFMAFVGVAQPEEFRAVTRGHVLAWRADLEKRGLAGSTIRRKLAALSSLYDYLCDANAVTHNPVRGVKRPKVESYEGKTPALGDAQARQLLDAPPTDTLKGKRDRAILSVLLYHALRREELTKLLVKDLNQVRRGVAHLRVHGKGGKLRYIPAHPATLRLVAEYLKEAGHAREPDGPLFRPARNPRAGHTATALTPGGVYSEVVVRYCARSALLVKTWGHMPCVRLPPPAPWKTMPTLSGSRNGWAMPTSARPGSMTGAIPNRVTRQPSTSTIEVRIVVPWGTRVSRT